MKNASTRIILHYDGWRCWPQECIEHNENLRDICLLAPFHRLRVVVRPNSFVCYRMYSNWQPFARSKPRASAFLSLFSKFMNLQYERSSGYHAGTPAPLWTQRHDWQRRLKPLTECLHVIRPSFGALCPHPPTISQSSALKHWARKVICSPHQWGVRNGTIKWESAREKQTKSC